MQIKIVSGETAKRMEDAAGRWLYPNPGECFVVMDGVIVMKITPDRNALVVAPINLFGIGRTTREALLSFADACNLQASDIHDANGDLVDETAPAAVFDAFEHAAPPAVGAEEPSAPAVADSNAASEDADIPF